MKSTLAFNSCSFSTMLIDHLRIVLHFVSADVF